MAPTEGMSRARYVMTGLSAAIRLANFVQRLGLPSLIPFIVTEFGFSDAQRAALLAGFFPGYMLSQIPAGIVSTMFGFKNILTVNLAGNALVLLLTPLAARGSASLGIAPLFCCFTAMGLLQGPLVPAMAVCHRSWMPPGPERAWGLRIYSLGGLLGKILTRISIPFLATRWGWRSVAYVYGGGCAVFAALWHAWAANSVEDWRGPPAMNDAEAAFLRPTQTTSKPAAKGKGGAAGGGLPLYLFKSPAALICCVCHMASNAVGACLDTWSPIYFTEVLGVSPLEAGRLLAIPSSCSLVSTFASGALDSALNSAGVSLVNIRRVMEGVACVIKAAGLVAFSQCRRPAYAVASMCVIEVFGTFHNSGHTASYLEVGGSNCGLLKSVGNTAANFPGYAVPLLGLMFVTRTGSYSPLFLIVSGFQFCAGLAYQRLVSVETLVDPRAEAEA